MEVGRCHRLKKALAAALVLSCLSLFTGVLGADASADENAAPSDFDFYVLALAWQPSFCARHGGRANGQCAAAPSSGFVVQGLWPQFPHNYPASCSNGTNARVDDGIVRSLAAIMPGESHITREWRTHGRCTGLSQKAYFDEVRKAYGTIRIPSDFPHLGQSVRPIDVVNEFLQANHGLPRDGISVGCDNHHLLREVRVCLTKTLKFRSCPELQLGMCKLRRAAMPDR